MSVDPPPASLRLRLDHAALAHNWLALDEMSGEAQAGAAIKADCYGLGVDACLPTLRDAGAAHFFVAHWGEVAAAANHVPPSSIAVLHGPMTVEDAAYARATGAIPVINSLEQARRWSEGGGGRCHLMVDTGINRLGIAPSQASDPAIQLLQVDVLMSHLACADEYSPMNARQLTAFRDVTGAVAHNSLSLANSAGIALGSDYAFDLTRPGLSLYGGIARPELAGTIKQVAYPEMAIIQTRNLRAGDRVGYNGEFTAPSDMRAGVVSLGYADGFLRSWGNVNGRSGSHLLHGEAKLPLLGKVSMDMVAVDLSETPDLREGDWLSLPYYLSDAAQQSALSQYELLTILGQRFG
ncbi:MAG: alanine racemase [Pseudomonadota bacterium]